MTLDPTQCPLCGENNVCAAAAKTTGCWCMTASIAPEVIARIPSEAQGVVCICQPCATGQRSPAEAQAKLEAALVAARAR